MALGDNAAAPSWWPWAGNLYAFVPVVASWIGLVVAYVLQSRRTLGSRIVLPLQPTGFASILDRAMAKQDLAEAVSEDDGLGQLIGSERRSVNRILFHRATDGEH